MEKNAKIVVHLCLRLKSFYENHFHLLVIINNRAIRYVNEGAWFKTHFYSLSLSVVR